MANHDAVSFSLSGLLKGYLSFQFFGSMICQILGGIIWPGRGLTQSDRVELSIHVVCSTENISALNGNRRPFGPLLPYNQNVEMRIRMRPVSAHVRYRSREIWCRNRSRSGLRTASSGFSLMYIVIFEAADWGERASRTTNRTGKRPWGRCRGADQYILYHARQRTSRGSAGREHFASGELARLAAKGGMRDFSRPYRAGHPSIGRSVWALKTSVSSASQFGSRTRKLRHNMERLAGRDRLAREVLPPWAPETLFWDMTDRAG